MVASLLGGRRYYTPDYSVPGRLRHAWFPESFETVPGSAAERSQAATLFAEEFGQFVELAEEQPLRQDRA